ncbi:hypothetical protein [Streptomyces sp. NPDC001843]
MGTALGILMAASASLFGILSALGCAMPLRRASARLTTRAAMALRTAGYW